MIDIKEFKPKYVTNEKGEKVEVVLSIETFRSLLEDLKDLTTRAKRLDEDTIPHADLLKELKSDGLL